MYVEMDDELKENHQIKYTSIWGLQLRLPNVLVVASKYTPWLYPL